MFHKKVYIIGLVLMLAGLAGCGGGGGGSPPDTTPPVTVASPPGGDYIDPPLVVLTASEPATIYYSLDGNDPDIGQANTRSGSSPIAGILIQPGQTTLKFFAIDRAGNRERVRTAVYTVAGASGTWIGQYQSELFPATPMRIDLVQVGASVTGNYVDANGIQGSFDATVSGYDFTFTVISTGGSCPGTFDGTGTISGDTLTFTFTGNNCLGTHQNGTGSVTRQAGKVLAFGLDSPAHLVEQAGMLYWSQGGESPVQRLPVSGGTPQPLARKMGVPTGLLFADSMLYWLDARTPADPGTCGAGIGRWRILKRSTPDGMATESLATGCVTGTSAPADLISDGQNLYWLLSVSTPNTFILQKVPLDGSDPVDLRSQNVPLAALVRDSGYLYWREQQFPDVGRIVRMPLGGGTVQVVYDASGTSNPLVGPMATNGTDLIYVDGVYPYPFTTLRLFRVGTGGGTPSQLTTLTGIPLALAADAQYVYGVDSGSVFRVPLTGGTPETLGSAGAAINRAVVDPVSGEAAWLDVNGALYTMPLTGGPPVLRASNLFHPGTLALGPDAIYVTEGDEGDYGHIESFGQIDVYDRRADRFGMLIGGIFEDHAPLAVVGGTVYVADGWRIKRIIPGGLAEVWYPGRDTIADIATDGTALYWFEGKAVITIHRRQIGSGTPVETLGTTNDYVEHMTTDGTNVYWVGGLDTLRALPVTGGITTTLVSGSVAISGFFSDGSHVYFAEQDTGNIKRVPVVGGAVQTLTTQARAFSWIALAGDATRVYWLDMTALGRVPKAGGTAFRIFDRGIFQSVLMGALTMDDNSLYWTESGSGTIKSWPK